MENKESIDEKFEDSFKKEVLKKSKKNLTEQQIKNMMKEARESVDFLQKIDDIELPTDKYVIFTDGKEQLYYENGEFFVISTTNSTKQRKKKTKKEATDMYLDFFIKYELNPILDQRDLKREKKINAKQRKTMQIQKENKTEIRNNIKEKEKKIERDDLSL